MFGKDQTSMYYIRHELMGWIEAKAISYIMFFTLFGFNIGDIRVLSLSYLLLRWEKLFNTTEQSWFHPLI